MYSKSEYLYGRMSSFLCSFPLALVFVSSLQVAAHPATLLHLEGCDCERLHSRTRHCSGLYSVLMHMDAFMHAVCVLAFWGCGYMETTSKLLCCLQDDHRSKGI
jgi:hypothetical protein